MNFSPNPYSSLPCILRMDGMYTQSIPYIFHIITKSQSKKGRLGFTMSSIVSYECHISLLRCGIHELLKTPLNINLMNNLKKKHKSWCMADTPVLPVAILNKQQYTSQDHFHQAPCIQCPPIHLHLKNQSQERFHPVEAHAQSFLLTARPTTE